ncbi:MAG: hypothetical protein K2X66_05420, partial [Cyanobacteria bacterium]|nr:hypothetical protein [Cyanobacteriota bacterium]
INLSNRDDEDEATFFLDLVWNSDETVRFVSLVYFDKSLLTYEEEVLWGLICDNANYWTGDFNGKEFIWDVRKQDKLLIDNVKREWELLKEISQGTKTTSSLHEWTPVERKADSRRISMNKVGNPYEDIPF